jgi:hypothetical protein
MPEENVFDECDHRIVNSGHAPTTKYRVSLGTPNWDSQDCHRDYHAVRGQAALEDARVCAA